MKEYGIGLCVGKFAENVTTEGICLYELPVGTKLKIGETLHEVTQIGKKCHAGDGCEIAKLTGKCIMPKEGIFTQPEHRARHQERTHFVSAVVEHARAPRIMLALTRVGVFIQRFAVKFVKPVRVFREVGGQRRLLRFFFATFSEFVL